MGGDQPSSRASLLRQPGTTHADPGREPRYSIPPLHSLSTDAWRLVPASDAVAVVAGAA